MKLAPKAAALAALASVATLLPAYAAESPDSNVLTLQQTSFKKNVDNQVCSHVLLTPAPLALECNY